jgi:hypothetical protein
MVTRFKDKQSLVKLFLVIQEINFFQEKALLQFVKDFFSAGTWHCQLAINQVNLIWSN